MAVPLISLHAETEAAAEQTQVLAKGDVERFIKTLPELSKEFEALGESLEGVDDPSQVQAIIANKQVQSIMQQYGWEAETYFTKMNVIAVGYALEKLAVELANIPAEQRAMMEQMMQQQMGGVAVHPADAALIKPHLTALTNLFDSM